MIKIGFEDEIKPYDDDEEFEEKQDADGKDKAKPEPAFLFFCFFHLNLPLQWDASSISRPRSDSYVLPCFLTRGRAARSNSINIIP